MKLVVYDDDDRVILVSKFESVEFEASIDMFYERQLQGRYYDRDRYYEPPTRTNRTVLRGNPVGNISRNEYSLNWRPVPLKDGSDLRIYRHKPIDRGPFFV